MWERMSLDAERSQPWVSAFQMAPQPQLVRGRRHMQEKETLVAARRIATCSQLNCKSARTDQKRAARASLLQEAAKIGSKVPSVV
jgi:hypothetical protein